MSLDASLASWLKLSQISGLGNEGLRQLLQAFGSPDAVLQASVSSLSQFIKPLPHAPSKEITARVISIYGGVGTAGAGQNSVVTLNKGKRDGLEDGHVLALYEKGGVERTPFYQRNIQLPDVRYGLLFVFRVFDKVSYALVMETKLPVKVLDRASTPK